MPEETNIFRVLLNGDLDYENDRDKAFKLILQLANNGLAALEGITVKQDVVNPAILLDTLKHFQKEINQFNGSIEFKIGGYLCYWVKN